MAQNQRQRILAALPLAVEKYGYEGTSVARILTLAGVSSRAFYAQFSGKRECFAAVHEEAQERLLAVITAPCGEAPEGLEERVQRAAREGLCFLAAEPALARLLALEAPAAGGEIAQRHHEWLGRYADLLGHAATGLPTAQRPSASTELTIAGGIVSRIAQKILAAEGERLPELAPELIEAVLTFYRLPVGLGLGEGAG